MSVDGGFQRLKTSWRDFVQLKTNRVSHSESPRVSALYGWLSVYAKQKVYRQTVTMSMSGCRGSGVEWMKRRRRSVAEAGHFEHFGCGIFLKLTSPKVVSRTLLSQIRTRTRFSHRPSDDRHLRYCMLHSKQSLAYLQQLERSLGCSSPGFCCLLYSTPYCRAERKQSTWEIFPSVIIISSQPAWRRIICHPAPVRISKHKPRQISIFGFGQSTFPQGNKNTRTTNPYYSQIYSFIQMIESHHLYMFIV